MLKQIIDCDVADWARPRYGLAIRVVIVGMTLFRGPCGRDVRDRPSRVETDRSVCPRIRIPNLFCRLMDLVVLGRLVKILWWQR